MRSLFIPFIGVIIIITILSSCNSERFIDARRILIWNYDTIPLEIFVNGEKAIEMNEFFGEVHLLSGEYNIVAKSKGKEIDRISMSLDREIEENEYNRFVFTVGKKRDYVLLDMRDLYYNGDKLTIEKKFFGSNYLKIETNASKMYWPWSILPFKIYTSGGSYGIYQLFELPEGYKTKNDNEIIAYCASLII
ncbi:MAG: hypothetical protein COA97_11895 [Flavobacteriales bacterium]|nr:MAG: hypothetical protein COA97_11895 [Flavobacteriales bacterium]